MLRNLRIHFIHPVPLSNGAPPKQVVSHIGNMVWAEGPSLIMTFIILKEDHHV